MQTKLETKETALEELRSSISPDSWAQWLNCGPTKALLMQLDIDSEDLKDNWAKGRFSEVEQVKAQAQAEYIDGLPHVVRALGVNDHDAS